MRVDHEHAEQALDPNDLRKIVEMVQAARASSAEPRVRRVFLFDGVSEYLDADHWKWVHSFLMPGVTAPRNIDFAHGGRVPLSMKVGVRHAIRAFEIDGVPPENIELSAMVRQRRPFVRTMDDLISEAVWRQEAGCVSYVRDTGMSEVLFGIVPIDGVTSEIEFTGAVLCRRTGSRRFDERDKAVFAAVLREAVDIHAGALKRGMVASVAELKLKCLLPLVCIAAGLSNKDIAAAIYKSVSTVHGYSKETMQSLGFRNRNRLRMYMNWPKSEQEAVAAPKDRNASVSTRQTRR